MPALRLILNNAYYANNYASIFDTGLIRIQRHGEWSLEYLVLVQPVIPSEL